MRNKIKGLGIQDRNLQEQKDCSGMRNKIKGFGQGFIVTIKRLFRNEEKNIGLGQGFKVGRTQYQEQEQ